MNYIGQLKNDIQLETLYATISGVFPYVKLFATNPMIELQQNIFFVASRRVLKNNNSIHISSFPPNENLCLNINY